MARKLKEVADFLQARLIGDGDVSVTGIASVQSATPGDLVFIQDEKNLDSALQSRASAIIVGKFAADKTYSKPVLITDDPRLAFARAAHLICPKPARVPGVHPSAIVHAGAKLGSVTVDERVVIAEGAEIADGTWIGAGCVIGRDVFIGEHCELHPNVTIYAGTRLANRVIVHAGSVLGSDGFGYARDPKTGRYEKFPQVGRLEIEDDVEIGANSTIDRGALIVTRIRRGTKLDNLVHVGHNVQIGTNVVIAAQAGLSGSAVIEDNVVIGGQVGIADHVRIEDGAVLGAQSGIPSKKIIRGKGVLFWGTPARPIRAYLKELALLARLAKKE
ncbi:MAG TPA: UDP-3-O-(3-hydroxymyristoyl)glucosamine N-acyltransferase [Terriglobales bacterium]|nr:UDP-3-O-(3-hydroxymyristoyl)glucosamine N-acyltransferase [Terriglobales bacterium]